MTTMIVDAGPMVSYLAAADQWHDWTVAQWSALPRPFLTCESALSEACFVVLREGGDPANVLALLQRGILKIALDLNREATALEVLMRRYADTPMSLADACLVRLAEIHPDCRVLTLDRDFIHYRRHGRQVIPLLSPW